MSYGAIKIIEKKIRKTRAYYEWVRQNKTSFCFKCSSAEDLHQHHIVSLYHVIQGYWNLYQDSDMVFEHVKCLHENNECESITLCESCHMALHPKVIRSIESNPVEIADWTCCPRKLPFEFCHSRTECPEGQLGLVATQLFFALGWFVMNGKAQDRMISVSRTHLASLMGKTNGTSFGKSLLGAILNLHSIGVIAGFLIGKHTNSVEIHLTPQYVDDLRANPWFVSMNNVQTSNSSKLALVWMLCTISGRRSFTTSMNKVSERTGIVSVGKKACQRRIEKACLTIPWASVDFKSGYDCEFTLKRKGATPIHSLRAILDDELDLL